MIYHKDKDKKYTDLCIEFDREFYTEDRDDFKLFKTMYLVYYMIASKRKFFEGPDAIHKYDDYAMFAATEMYMRFIRKQKKGERIKSLLNYAKSNAGRVKMTYQDENYKQDSYKATKKDSLIVAQMQEKLRESVQQDYYYDIREQTESIINVLPKIIHGVVRNTPYRKDKLMIKHLEMSCMLTLISQLTLSNKNLDKIDKKESKSSVIESPTVFKYLNEERNDVVCWKVSDGLADYVRLLVNKIRKNLSVEIYKIKSSYELSDDVLDSVIYSAYGKEDTQVEEEY